MQCNCKELLDSTMEELLQTMKDNEELEECIKLIKEDAKIQRITAEEKWKERCLEISKIISDKMFEEKNRFIDEIKNLEKCNNN